MKKIALLITLFIFKSTFAQALSAAKFAELASHRIEKLVTLNKIESSFISNLQIIEVQKLPAGNVNDPAFIATSSQYAGSDATKKQVEMIFDIQGKALSFKTKSGTASNSAPQWPQKSATTLIENALHHIIDHAGENSDLKPFNDGLFFLELKPMSVSNQNIAQVVIHSTETQKFLHINLQLDGKLINYEVK